MSDPQTTTPLHHGHQAHAQARPSVPAPEHHDQQAQTAIAPMPPVAQPHPHTPHTPHPHVAPVGHGKPEAANGAHDGKSLTIEQHLATFIGDRLPAGMAEGLMVDVTLVQSNAVTGEGEKNRHDIAIAFKGGKLEDPATAQQLSELLRAAMREHPAFHEMSFGGIDTKIEHMMRCSILGLEPERLQALLTPQPRKTVTFVAPPATATPTHTCTGAGCAHHHPAEVAPATPIAPPATPAPEQKPTITAVAPEVTQVAPPTSTVEAPVQQLGRTAANGAHIQLAG